MSHEVLCRFLAFDYYNITDLFNRKREPAHYLVIESARSRATSLSIRKTGLRRYNLAEHLVNPKHMRYFFCNILLLIFLNSPSAKRSSLIGIVQEHTFGEGVSKFQHFGIQRFVSTFNGHFALHFYLSTLYAVSV